MTLGVGVSLFSFAPALAPTILCSADPCDGVLGPCGRGGRGSALVGHPLGCPGWAAGTGSAGVADVEGEGWGRLGLWDGGILLSSWPFASHHCSHSL